MKKKTDNDYQKEQADYEREHPEEAKAPDVSGDAPAEAASAPKSDDLCTIEGCTNPKQPGQTYLCAQHVRAG